MGPLETGLDSPFHSKPIDPGFESCLGRSARLARNAEFSPIYLFTGKLLGADMTIVRRVAVAPTLCTVPT